MQGGKSGGSWRDVFSGRERGGGSGPVGPKAYLVGKKEGAIFFFYVLFSR